MDGVLGSRVKEQIGRLEARKAELEALLAEIGDAAEPPLVHPSLKRLYHAKIAALHEVLNREDRR